MKITILYLYSILGVILCQSIVKPPSDTTGEKGGTATFVCEVEYGEHIPTITWKFNDKIIYFYMDYKVDYPLGTNKYVVSNSEAVFELTVMKLNYTDGGNYICKVFGEEKSAALIVLGLPVITQETDNLMEGKLATYTCVARFGGPSLDTILPDYLPQMKLFLDDVIYVAHANTKNDNSIRKVYAIMVDDSMDTKKLKCEIGTTKSKQNLTSTSLVNVRYSVRNITYSPQEEQYVFGSNITCSARGNPNPLYEWRKRGNSEIITKGQLLHITDDMEGENSWTCTARNSVGDDMYEDEITAKFEAVSVILQDEADLRAVIFLVAVGCIGVGGLALLAYKRFINIRSKFKKSTATTSFAVTTAATVFGSSFQHGWNTGVLNIPQHSIKHFINESFTEHYGFAPSSGHVEMLWIVCMAIYLVSGCFGVIIAGTLADGFGRKYALLFCHPFKIVAAIMFGICKIAHSFELLIVGRFLAGFGCGAANRLVLMYLSDIAPDDIQHEVSMMHRSGLTFGIFLSQIVGIQHILGNESRWPYMLALTILPSLASLLIISWFPQSPVDHLIKHTEAQKLKKILEKEVAESVSHNAHCSNAENDNNENVDPDAQKAELVDNGNSEMQMKIKNTEEKIEKHKENAQKAFETFQRNETSRKTETSQQFTGFEEYYRTYMAKEKVTERELFQPEWKALSPCLILLCGLNLFQRLSGIYVVFYYSLSLFEASGVPQDIIEYCVLSTGAINVFTTGVSVVGDFKHRRLLLIGMLIMIISSLFMTLALHLQVFYISVLSTNTFVLGFALGFGSVTTCIGRELFFAGPRTPAITIASSCNWLANIFVAVVFPILHVSAGPNSLWIFTIILVISFIFFFIKLPETKDKSLKKIYEELEIPINNKWPIEAEQPEEMPLVEIKQIPTQVPLKLVPIEFCSTPI